MKSPNLPRRLNLCSHVMVVLSAIVLSGGCQQFGKPRLRFGAFWGSPIGMQYTSLRHLGKHSYEFTLYETNGIMYTCNGGFIDIAHVRESADRTAYLQKRAYQSLMHGNQRFSFQVVEPSTYWVTLTYPDDWDRLSKRKRQIMAREVSIDLGEYLAHTTLIWHEIITWYGFASAGVFPDTISAFSPEDPYSDVLGVLLAGRALRDERKSYDQAMTDLLPRTLEKLGVQPASVARQAGKQIEGRWYTGGFYFLVHMKKRNLDVGLGDNRVTPWLVPGICPDAKARSLSVPDVGLLHAYGFDVAVEMEPHVLEKGKIYQSIGLAKHSRIRPETDFPKILTFIGKHETGSVASAAMR
jgi:hypothetical protein